jgi:3-dehydroquinate synthetase
LGLGLPVRIPGIPLGKLEEAMGWDKKARLGRLRWVLLAGKGKPVIREDVPLEVVREVLLSLGARPAASGPGPQPEA